MPYNPYNGNYYGDGSDVQRNSAGQAIANIHTGATYTNLDNSSSSDSNRFARSDDSNKAYVGSNDNFTSNASHTVDMSGNSSKNVSDWYTDVYNNFNKQGYSQASWDAYYRDQVYRSGNQALIGKYEHDQQRIAMGLAPTPDVRGDYRGFATNHTQLGTDGRLGWFNPATGQYHGNVNLFNPDYNLMHDPNYSYGVDYYYNEYENWIKSEMEKGMKLTPDATPQNLAATYTQNWLTKQYKAQDEKLKANPTGHVTYNHNAQQSKNMQAYDGMKNTNYMDSSNVGLLTNRGLIKR